MATKHKRRHLLLDARALFSVACSGNPAEEKRKGAAADVTLRSVFPSALPSPAREVDSGEEITKAIPPGQRRRPIISWPLVCAPAGWKSAAGFTTEARLPGRRLVRRFRACLPFSPRAVSSAGQPRWASQRGRPSDSPAIVGVFPARGFDSGRAETERSLPERHGHPIISPRLICETPE